MNAIWMFTSAGVTVTLSGPELLAGWWPALNPQIPGTAGGPLAEMAGPAALILPGRITSRDARLLINAHLHGEHLRHGTISIHGVAARDGSEAVLLLGGHGAGKTMTALALMADGAWRPAAGDTCLLRAEPEGRGVLMAGGTRSFVVRRGEADRWFPGLLPAGGGQFLDLAGDLPPQQPPEEEPVPTVVLAAMVRVDNCGLDYAPCDLQTARNGVYRASSHLIDKVPDDPGLPPLRLVESLGLARDRVTLARKIAASVPCWTLRGSPQAVARQIIRLVKDGSAVR